MSRLHYTLLALACLIVLMVSALAMARRVDAFNEANQPARWVFSTVNARDFLFGGHEVHIADTTTPDGADLVTVSIDKTEALRLTPSSKPKDASLPGLARHEEWLKVIRFAELGKRSFEEFQAHIDQGNDRIAIVVKRPLTGPDPRTGDVWQRDWMFDFHELGKDGSVRSEGLRFPRTKGDRTPKANELQSGTWQMDAALHLMPKTPPDSMAIGRPTAAFRKTAMRSLGWTLPVAALSALGLIVCLSFAAAPRRKPFST